MATPYLTRSAPRGRGAARAPLWLALWALLALALPPTLTGCAAAPPPPPEGEQVRVWITDHGWHTGVVVALEDIPKDLILEKTYFEGMRYLEIGWGDRGFYMEPEVTSLISMKALFWPTDSVVHLVGFHRDPPGYFPKSGVRELSLSRGGVAKMLAFMDGAFERPASGGPSAPIKEGIYGRSHFFPSGLTYMLPITCNVWTARALERAGYRLNAWTAWHSKQVMSRLAMD